MVNEPRATRTGSPVAEECRRLAELLRMDTVGVVTSRGGRRRVAWWSTPGSPPLPARLDDVLEGRTGGWIVVSVDQESAVFGRTTAETSDRAEATLRTLGPSLTESVEAEDEHEPVPASPPPVVSIPPHADAGDVGLRESLQAILDDSGFQTASLYQAVAARGWELIERAGPERPWHAVLDPSTLAIPAEGVAYPDVRSAPGVGPRLAALGCGALAAWVLPEGGRLIADSDRRMPGVPAMERLHSTVASVARLARGTTLDWPGRDEEMEIVARVSQVARETVQAPGATALELLHDVRVALGADEAFHLALHEGSVDVVASPTTGWPKHVSRELREALRTLPLYGPLDEASARQLGVVLGASSAHLSAAFGQETEPQEALVAGWRKGPGLSHGAMKAVAEITGAARAMLESRRQTVEALLMRERTRFAYEVHDGLTQAVTTAVLELEALGHQIERDPRGAALTLSTTKAEIRKSLSELRGLLYDISSEERGPAIAAEEPLTRYVNDVVRRWRLPARVSVSGDLQDLPKPVLGTAYVVVREALANAAKHAGAGKVTVWLNATPEGLTVEVGDTGRGFSSPGGTGNEPGRHFGLDMMRKRVAEIGGTLDVRSAPGKGTRVVAHLPVGGERREGPAG